MQRLVWNVNLNDEGENEMKNKISILFFGKKSRMTSSNLLPIYLRVTIRGRRFEISTHRNVPHGKWSIEAGRMKGNTRGGQECQCILGPTQGEGI